jgi:hypothetical protein
MVTSVGGGTAEYGNVSSILSLFQSTIWWLDIDVNIYVCFDAYFFLPGHPGFFCDVKNRTIFKKVE